MVFSFYFFRLLGRSKYLMPCIVTVSVLEYAIFISSCLYICFSVFILIIFLYLSLFGKKVEHKYVNTHALKIHCMFVSIDAHRCLRWHCGKAELEPLRKSLSAVTPQLHKPLLGWGSHKWKPKGRFDSSGKGKIFCWHREIFLAS